MKPRSAASTHRNWCTPRQWPPPIISRLALAGVFVDTWPCKVHITVADVLWIDVPGVTCSGTAIALLVAASVLSATGSGEVAFETVHD